MRAKSVYHMQIPLIAANWKSNFTYKEAEDWLNFFKGKEISGGEIVVFPSFTFLGEVGHLINEYSLPFKVGAQDLSSFDQGAFTGEVNADQLKDFVEYVLIGHSERRKLFNETQEEILMKLDKAYKANLKVILCISKIEELDGVSLDNLVIAYEPLDAIGSGNPESAEKANDFAKEIKNKLDGARVIYGGSVDQHNVSGYLEQENIGGVLVGGKSLDPQSFLEIIQNAG